MIENACKELILADGLYKFDHEAKKLILSVDFEQQLTDYCKGLNDLRLKFTAESEVGGLTDNDVTVIGVNRKNIERAFDNLKTFKENIFLELTKDFKKVDVYLATLQKTMKDFVEFDKDLKRLNLQARKNAIKNAICIEFYNANLKQLPPDENGEIKEKLNIDEAIYNKIIDKINAAEYNLSNFENSIGKLKADKINEVVEFYIALLVLFQVEAGKVLIKLRDLKREGKINPNFYHKPSDKFNDDVNQLAILAINNFTKLDDFGKIPYISNLEAQIIDESQKWLENKKILQEQEQKKSQLSQEQSAELPIQSQAPKTDVVKENQGEISGANDDEFEIVQVDISDIINSKLAILRKDPDSLANAILSLQPVLFKVEKNKTSNIEKVKQGIIKFLFNEKFL